MELVIVNQTTFQITKSRIEMVNKIMENTLTKFDPSIRTMPGEVSLQLVTSEMIKSLNKQYRGHDKPTDVLSFPQYSSEEWKKIISLKSDLDFIMLGDIVISDSAVEEQAKAYGHSIDRELSFLFLHGLLHLLGYDHEGSTSADDMFYLQESILSELGITRE